MCEERITQKIQKLLALSQSSNQHEAANALAKAQLLMEKYGLSQKSIEMSKIGSIEKDGLVRAINLPNWYKAFTGLIARCFGVRTIMDREHGESGGWCKSAVIFVGQKDRIDLAAYCYEVVGRQILNARKSFNKDIGKMDPNKKWKIVEAFCEGIVNTLESKIKTFAIDPKEKDLIEEKLSEMFPRMETAKIKERELSSGEFYALCKGEECGAEICLFRPMDGTETPKLSVQK